MMLSTNNHNYRYPEVAVLVFCKAPIPGQVKTRLISPATNPEAAASAHMRLTRQTLALVSDQSLCPLQLWVYPDCYHAFFQSCVQDYGVSLHLQQGDDLGARMHAALVHALQDYRQVLILGCDCPSLTIEDLNRAIKALSQDKQVVLAPAEDGGYTLIGLNSVQADLFTAMNWGSSEVLACTRKRINHLGLNCLELAEQWDVDLPQDLARYDAMRSITKDKPVVKQIELLISGRVQGVFFRVSAQNKARQLHLNGWVKNLADGRVAIVARGEISFIDEFIIWCHQGPDGALVSGIQLNNNSEAVKRQGFYIF